MSRTLPTEMNRKTKKIEKALHGLLTDIIQVRTDAVKKGGSECYGKDLLGLMLIAADKETASKGGKVQFGMQPLIEECKLFFFAGHETSSSLLTWALMFLGTYTEWQDRARKEVMELCRDGSPPDIETISNMKVVSGLFYRTSLSKCSNHLLIVFQFHSYSRHGYLNSGSSTFPSSFCPCEDEFCILHVSFLFSFSQVSLLI